MTGLAIAIVMVSALLHAGWNYLAKRSHSKMAFIFCFLSVAMVLYLPLFLYYAPRSAITWSGWLFVGATGVIHFFYFILLGGAYERGDLSLVYPLSRGSAPILVPLGALIFIGEKLSVGGVLGIMLVVGGIYCVHLPGFGRRALAAPFTALRGKAALWAILTGVAIAAYSLVDKIGVSLVHPVTYIYLMHVLTWLLLAPFVLGSRRTRLVREWRLNRVPILAGGIMVLGSYLLILIAFQFAKVSYVVAMREISVLFSVLFGVGGLKEQHGWPKTAGALLIAGGVVLVGLAH